MRIVQIGDIHVSDKRVNEFEILLKQLSDSIKLQKPDLIVFTGDMFVHRDRLSPKQVELARNFFKGDLSGYDQIFIPGNHDISMSTTKVDSLSAIFTSDYMDIFTKVKTYKDIGAYRFHFFPYPSKEEMNRLGVDDIAKIYSTKEVFEEWEFSEGKKNILVYHGTLEGFSVSDSYEASETSISVGRDLVLPKTFWSKFDAVMAGHLHRYQAIDNAVYSGAFCPLTYADNFDTGYIVWNNLVPSFIQLKQLYPFVTIDIGNLFYFPEVITDEAERRVRNTMSYDNTRVRVKYTIYNSQAGLVDHTKISRHFVNAKEIKIVPRYKEHQNAVEKPVSFEQFKHHSMFDMIVGYIDDKKYPSEVRDVAKKIESRLVEKGSEEEGRGIHFKMDKLTVSNFKCFGEKNITIDFNELSTIVGIFGDNKTGKSSLVEAIVWALFGSTLRNKEVKSVIRNGEKTTNVVLEFTSYDQRYKIDRTRNTTGAILNLFCLIDDVWKDISGATALVTQKSIEKLVGSFDIFVSTIYSPQNNIDLLIQKKPSERKQIILDCLQIDVLTKRQKEIGEFKKEVRDEINQIRGKLTTYGDQLAEIVKSEPATRQKEFEGFLRSEKIEQVKLQTRIVSYSKKIFEYEELSNEHDSLSNSIDKYRAQIKEISGKIGAKNVERKKLEEILVDKSILDDKLKRIDDLEISVKRYASEQQVNVEKRRTKDSLIRDRARLIEEHKSKSKILEDSKNSIMSSIRGFKTLDCPEPNCPINKKINEQISSQHLELNKLEEQIEINNVKFKDSFDSFTLKIEGLDREIKNSFYDQTAHMRYIRALELERRNKWEDLKYKIASGEDILLNINELIGAFQVQKANLQEDRDSLINKRSNLAIKINSIQNYKKEVDSTKLKLETVEKNMKVYEGQIYTCKRDMEDIQKLQNNISDVQVHIEKKNNELSYCNKYAEIVSKQGVIYAIVDKSIPIIEKFAQDILSETTNGMINISMDSYRVLSGGNKSDEVIIQFTDSKGKRDIMEASGAETVLISLALRAAMAHLLSLRMGSKVELFIIDEGLGVFDRENLTIVKNLLQKLGEKFNKLFFITHVERAKDVAESIIKLKTNGLISTYEIIHEEVGYDSSS